MVSELGTNGKNSIDLLESWRHTGALGCRNELTRASKDIAEVPRYAASESLLEAFLKDRPYPTIRNGNELKNQTVKPAGLRLTTRVASPNQPRFSFRIPDSATKPLDICLKPLSRVWYGVKRRRNRCDVDGFNTASLSSKKRRLRTELITSRLSQPYSQPATHILNREGQESGDKRFLKMATTVDTARRIAHLHATSFLRYSVMNRVRRRLGLNLSQQTVKPREHDQEDVVVAVPPAMGTSWKPPSLLASSAGKSPRQGPVLKNDSGSSAATSPIRSEKTVNVSKPVHPLAKTHACRLSKPVALPLPVSDLAATKKRTSPRIHPIQSPEMGPSLLSLDDVEEDSFAFLHPEDDDWDDGEDADNVYSDFSVIFGEGSPVAEAQEERTYEEYLDELDGICWITR